MAPFAVYTSSTDLAIVIPCSILMPALGFNKSSTGAVLLADKVPSFEANMDRDLKVFEIRGVLKVLRP
jgi:hypothetical protein